nr:hypothetical protein [uncultured Acetatifactor sp.]
MGLGEKSISLTENAVEKRGYDTNTETARSFRDNTGSFCDSLEVRLLICKICSLWYAIFEVFENKIYFIFMCLSQLQKTVRYVIMILQRKGSIILVECDKQGGKINE